MLASETELTVAGAVTHQVANNYLILEFGDRKTDQSSIRISDLDDNKEVLTIPGPYTCYNVSHGNHPAIVVSRTIDEGTYSVRVYDLSGEFLFSLDDEQGGLLPSPNGMYFFTTNDFDISVIPRVFDRSGREIFVVRNVRGGGWDVNALTDSLLVLLSDRIYVYDVFGGGCIKRIEYPSGLPRDIWSSKVPSIGGKLIAFTPNSSLLIDTTLDISWSDNFDNAYIVNATVSQSADLALFYLKEPADRSGYTVRLVDCATATTTWQSGITTNYLEVGSNFPSLLIDDDYASIKTPQIDYYLTGKLDTSTKTVIYTIAPNTGKLITTQSIEGVVDIVKTKSDRLYLLKRDSNSRSMLTVEHSTLGVEK